MNTHEKETMESLRQLVVRNVILQNDTHDLVGYFRSTETEEDAILCFSPYKYMMVSDIDCEAFYVSKILDLLKNKNETDFKEAFLNTVENITKIILNEYYPKIEKQIEEYEAKKERISAENDNILSDVLTRTINTVLEYDSSFHIKGCIFSVTSGPDAGKDLLLFSIRDDNAIEITRITFDLVNSIVNSLRPRLGHEKEYEDMILDIRNALATKILNEYYPDIKRKLREKRINNIQAENPELNDDEALSEMILNDVAQTVCDILRQRDKSFNIMAYSSISEKESLGLNRNIYFMPAEYDYPVIKHFYTPAPAILNTIKPYINTDDQIYKTAYNSICEIIADNIIKNYYPHLRKQIQQYDLRPKV